MSSVLFYISVYLIIPLIVGFFASFVAWFTVASIKPKIIIDKIFLEPTATKSKYCYRLKVKNDGAFNVYDVTVSGRIVLKVETKDLIVPIRTHVVKVGNGKSPYIPGRRESSNQDLRIRWHMLSIPQYTKENLERLATEFVVKHKEGAHMGDEDTHARVSKLGLEQFYKRWNRCLTTMPKILLGENIV